MPLASSGLRALPAPRTMGTIGRSIHIPAFIPRPVAKSTGTRAQTFFKQTRTFLSRLVTHLTAPGSFATSAHIPKGARSIYAGPTRARTIQQGFSFPTRYALSRPFAGPYLPRPPSIPRSVVQVGLGTARNFSTARPIFQNIVDNVPITGRAFWQADWDINLQKEKAMMRPKKYSKGKENKRNSSKAALAQPVIIKGAVPEETSRAELDHYFPAPAVPDVTTYLLIPLAPTPTSRLPLSVSPSAHSTSHPLLPFSLLAGVHNDHGTHALRVSTLFSRLDASHVFEQPTVTCSAFGGPGGMCTVLEVKFAGWTESRVRSILGEAGTGWCVLEEVRENAVESQAMDDALSEMSFDTQSVSSSPSPFHEEMDPSASFVLPTLDFSSPLPVETDSWAHASSTHSAPISGLPMSDLEFHNAWTSLERDLDSVSDSLSEVSFSDSDSGGWGDSLTSSRRSSTGSEGWVGLRLSPQFTGDTQGDLDVEEPREAMF